MYKVISVTLADGTPGELQLLANASTAIRYKQIFGKDIMKAMGSLIDTLGADNLKTLAAHQDKEYTVDNMPPELVDALSSIINSGTLDMMTELAYVMNRQAQAKTAGVVHMMSVDDFVDWLDLYDSTTFLSNALLIWSVYMNNKLGDSTQKKSDAQLNVK